MKRDWIDVSVPVRSGMVHWPGDTPVSVEQVQSLIRGDAYNLSRLEMSAHSGTHMDAPLHFRTGARPIDALPFAAVIGPARVIEIRDAESIKPDELREQGKPEHQCLFLRCEEEEVFQVE